MSNIFVQTPHDSIVLNVTTTERNNLSVANGFTIYNTTTSTYQCYQAGTWVDISNLATAQEYTASQNFAAVSLTFSANINWNLMTSQVAKLTLTGDAILNNPNNMKDGGIYILLIKQDAVGGHELAYDSNYIFARGIVPSLTSIGNGRSVLVFMSDGTYMHVVQQKGFE